MSSSSYHHLPPLPEEIGVEILLKLPSKSLFRSKSVCKRWRDLINNPQMLIKHFFPARGGENHHSLLVKRRDKTTKEPVFSFLPGRTQTRPLPFPEIPVIESYAFPEFPVIESEIEILGPCNGLVCLFDSNTEMGHHIVLWRPSDGEMKTLPPSDVLHDQPEFYISNPQIGFGYDDETEDYKVVRMGAIVDHGYEVGSKIEIYSFNKDTWKGEARDDHPLPLHVNEFSTTSINGMLFWLAWDNQIIWFRISDESFGTIAIPIDARDIDPRFDSLGELVNPPEYKKDDDYAPYWQHNLFAMKDENLALVVHDSRSRTEKCFHVWVLFESCVEESWTKVFTVGPLVGMKRPVWFWRNRKVIVENNEGELVSCDLLTNDMES